jgi:hypothetical protein
MRRRSVTGPVMLLLIGCLFLWHNLHPEFPVFDMVAQYWPFALIVWGILRLIEVMIPRGDGWRSTFSGGEVVLIGLLCVAGLGVWHAYHAGIHFNSRGLEWFGEQFDYPVSASAPATGMKLLVLENPRGNIRVVGGDVQQVTVSGHKLVRSYARAEADRTNENTPVEIVPEGDRLVIRTNQERAPDNQRVSDDLDVTVPRGMSVESRGNVADYDVSDIAGDLELSSNRGDVRLARVGGNAHLEIGHSDLIRAEQVKGKVDLQGSGSDVDLEDIAGQVTINGSYNGTLEFKNLEKPLQFEGARNTELHAEAIPGRINMDRGSLTATGVTGPTRFVTRSRDIKFEQFTQGLTLETERGDIVLHPGKLPLGTVEARTGGGRIDLTLPGGATFQLEATAERGDAENGYGPPIQRESEGHRTVLRGKAGDGPTINLTANHGSISVHKEGGGTNDAAVSEGEKTPKLPKDLKETEVRM